MPPLLTRPIHPEAELWSEVATGLSASEQFVATLAELVVSQAGGSMSACRRLFVSDADVERGIGARPQRLCQPRRTLGHPRGRRQVGRPQERRARQYMLAPLAAVLTFRRQLDLLNDAHALYNRSATADGGPRVIAGHKAAPGVKPKSERPRPKPAAASTVNAASGSKPPGMPGTLRSRR